MLVVLQNYYLLRAALVFLLVKNLDFLSKQREQKNGKKFFFVVFNLIFVQNFGIVERADPKDKLLRSLPYIHIFLGFSKIDDDSCYFLHRV